MSLRKETPYEEMQKSFSDYEEGIDTSRLGKWTISKNKKSMDKNKQYKIALVLYTQGLDYDDRIRKEMLSIKSLFPNIDFKIFAVEPNNREENGVTSYGIAYRIPYLKSRDKYASGTHTLQKAWDFYKTIKKDLKVYDAVWCADPETFIFVLMLRGKPVAWDLHELPLAFMGNPIMRLLFRSLERKCKVMVHANEPRLRYLEKIGMVKFPQKQFVLRNYPQFNEIDTEYDDVYHRFVDWKGTAKCVYLQGLNNSSRAALETIKAVLSFKEIKGVVVGGFDNEIKEMLIKEYGEDFLGSRILFVGRIKQLKTPQYIRQCCMGLVFYKNTSPNNWYCEPNRLFQNVINGKPVVVGNNPPMKEFVEKNKVGVSVDTDGENVAKIVEGMKIVLDNLDNYNNFRADIVLWDTQNDVGERIVNKFI